MVNQILIPINITSISKGYSTYFPKVSRVMKLLEKKNLWRQSFGGPLLVPQGF